MRDDELDEVRKFVVRSFIYILLMRKGKDNPFKSRKALKYYCLDICKGLYINNKFGIEITRTDFLTLKKNVWLNDKIINFYFEMLQEHSKKHNKKLYCFSSYFFPTLMKNKDRVHNWLDSNLFENDLIFMPIYLPNHWIFVCYDKSTNLFEYFDSLYKYNKKVGVVIYKFLNEHHIKYKGVALKGIKLSIPFYNNYQENGSDCGVYTCINAKRKLEGITENFNVSYLKNSRLFLSHEIYIGKIIYETNFVLTEE